MRQWKILLLVFCLVRPAWASLSLVEAEEKALNSTPRLKAAELDTLSAVEQAEGQSALRWPRVSLDSSYRYLSKLPQLSLGGPPVIFGDHSNYSLGGTLSYTVFDAWSRSQLALSVRALASARDSERLSLRRSILSGVRTSYIRAQLAQQETRVVLESFELAKSQSSEIAQRFRAGSASRLDSLNAQREVATYELKFSQSRAEEEAAGIDLLSLTGEKDPAVPPQGLKLDSLQVSGERLEIKTLATFSPEQHPLAVAQNALAQSAEHAATSQLRSYWPNVQFQARTSLDYPNGPVREQFHQNTLQVNLSMPVWDWGYTGDQVAQKRAEAQSALAKRENALVELRREYQKILARLESLKSQKNDGSTNREAIGICGTPGLPSLPGGSEQSGGCSSSKPAGARSETAIGACGSFFFSPIHQFALSGFRGGLNAKEKNISRGFYYLSCWRGCASLLHSKNPNIPLRRYLRSDSSRSIGACAHGSFRRECRGRGKSKRRRFTCLFGL
jgi:outer membrane protein TolC